MQKQNSTVKPRGVNPHPDAPAKISDDNIVQAYVGGRNRPGRRLKSQDPNRHQRKRIKEWGRLNCEALGSIGARIVIVKDKRLKRIEQRYREHYLRNEGNQL